MKYFLVLPVIALLSSASPPQRPAARPASFRVSTPLRADPFSLFFVGLQADPDGYVILGNLESTSIQRRSVSVTAAGSSGRRLWSRTYGARHAVRDLRALRTSDGGFLVWGREEPAGPGHSYPYFLRVDAKGESLWCRSYGGCHRPPCAIEQTPDGGFIIAGAASGVYLLKTNARGDTLWRKSYGGTNVHSLDQTADGGYVLTGVSQGEVYLIRTDTSGINLWSRSWGSARGFDYDEGWSVKQTGDGGFVVLAWFEGPNPGPGTYLVRTDGNGDTLWMRAYGPRLGRWSLWQTSDGGFMLAGWKPRHPRDGGMHEIGDSKVYIVRTDAAGDTLWTRTLEDTVNDHNCSAFKTRDDGLAVAWVDIPTAAALLRRPDGPATDSGKIGVKSIIVDERGNVFRP